MDACDIISSVIASLVSYIVGYHRGLRDAK